ncbi:MAG: anaerobic ribonucleoside-triphosphate reductase activating protein [Endomicrobium sp.]|nr:anaerobic ribonucleoside-triphosphate reductase activating protein [Endomicrobium sp.]
MKIGGLQKLSLIDYPGAPAAVIFTQGCNMACSYCHNPQLVYPYLFERSFDEDEIFVFLSKRTKLLRGIVITGGEPTIQKDLLEFITAIKNLNFFIKLDTNGTNPQILQELIAKKLIDFVAMDIKSSMEKYNLFFKGDLNLIKQSINIIKSSGLPSLFRTTYDTDILNEKDLSEIKDVTSGSEYIIQKCKKMTIM